MRKWQKIAAWLVYVGVVGWFGFGWEGWMFVVGNVVAWGLGLVDKLIYAWWLYPFEQSSIQIQYWTRKRDVLAVLDLLLRAQLNQQKLLFKSLGFGVMWVLLAWYVASSTGSVVAMGIVMGLGFELGWSLVTDWKQPQKIASWYCWQIKRKISDGEVRWFAGLYVGAWLMYVLQLVWG